MDDLNQSLKRERGCLDWPKLKTPPLALPASIIGAYNPDKFTDVASRRKYWPAGKMTFGVTAMQAAKGAEQASPIQIRLNNSDDLASKLTALHLLLAVNARTL